jgi:5-methylcytosine-specific restriction enzyme A
MNRDDPAYRKEREKARKLKQTQWWQSKRARGICAHCGQVFEPSELTMDHLIAISRGGKSTKGNVVPSCKSCNNEKKNLTPVEIILSEQMGKDIDF